MCLVSLRPNSNFSVGKNTTAFATDQELIKYALVTLQQSADPDDIICSDALTLDRTSLKNSSGNYYSVFG
jgi:hypothetical protein